MQKKICSGFLIAECMIVIALCVMVIVFSFSLTNVFKGVVTSVEVGLLKKVVQAQQAIALLSGQECKVKIDQQQRTYTYDGVTHQLAQPVEFIFSKDALGPPSNPTVAIHAAISFAEHTIVCFPTGSISGGTIYMGCRQANKFFALSSGVSEWGFLRLYYMKNNKWVRT